MDIKKKVTPLVEYVAESTSACLVTMVQGNVLAIGLSHLVIASQTGIVAGSIATVALLMVSKVKPWVIPVVLGVATGVVDYYVHPGMIGPVFLEAVITGIAAGLLSILVGFTVKRFRREASSPE